MPHAKGLSCQISLEAISERVYTAEIYAVFSPGSITDVQISVGYTTSAAVSAEISPANSL